MKNRKDSGNTSISRDEGEEDGSDGERKERVEGRGSWEEKKGRVLVGLTSVPSQSSVS